MRFGGRLVLLVTALLLAACASSPQRQQLVDELIERERLAHAAPGIVARPGALDRLLPEPDQHHLLVIDQGVDALALRLKMIRSARAEILYQNYIFHDDSAGLLVLDELLAAAGRGVRVRLLVDGLFSLADPALLARLELAPEAFELRMYSPLFQRAVTGNLAFGVAIACCFRTLNHRMHNKLVAIDGQHGLVGGRNTADRYFDLDTRMNFYDLEVLVSGPVVADMVAGFDAFWQHARSRPARQLRDVERALLRERWLPDWPVRPERLAFAAELAEDPQWLEALLAERGHRVASVEYFTDPPDKPWTPAAKPGVDSTDLIHRLLAGAERQVLIQTPYFVMSPDFDQALRLASEQARVVVSSNSLAATDAYPVYAISRRQRQRVVGDLGIEFYESKPFPAARHRLISRYPELITERSNGLGSRMRGDQAAATRPMPGPRVTLHAKIMVLDETLSVVGSHNFDPRSEIYNSENGIIVHDPDFARAMIDYIEPMTQPANAWRVAGRPSNGSRLAATNSQLSRQSRRLPTLDLWPAYQTENYQLPSGAHAVDPEHPDFHSIWVPVGMAPEVTRGQRRFLTAVISRMFGFLWPIM